MAKLSTFLFLFIGILLNSNVAAQPELDTTFGGGGFYLNNSGAIVDIAVQPDGKVFTLGGCNSQAPFGYFTFCVYRLNDNGSPDTTFGNFGFGTSGFVLTRVPGISENSGNFSSGIAVQNDNKILAVGAAYISAAEHPVFVRYESNGMLDSTFGTGGFVITPINGIAKGLVIQPDGKFLVVGFTGSYPNYQHFVARYLSDGTIDTSFGNNGISTLAVAGNLTRGFSISLQPDGKILTGGALSTLPGEPTPSASYLLTRLNSDGTLDTTFDDDGFKTVPFVTTSGYISGFEAIALQTDGRILALGYLNILYRFNPDGSLDTSFDGDGSREALNGNSGRSDVYDLVVTPGGKITVVGFPTISRFTSVPVNYRVARYLSNGSPDTSFSNDGFIDINATPASLDGATSVATDNRGRVIIGGQSAPGYISDPWRERIFSMLRLTASPVQNVGISGRVVNLNGRPVANASVTLQSGLTTIKVGRTNPFGYFNFQNVESGQTYNISVKSKGLFFNDRSLLVDDAITNLTIFGKRLP
jgi:uncharacterized delta-60 repeat protein